jgi:membrane-associated phospholipid phosphatase
MMSDATTLPRLRFVHHVQRHLLLGIVVLAYGLIAYSVSWYAGAPVREERAGSMFAKFLIDVPMMVFFVLLWRLLDLTYVQRDPDRFGTLRDEVLGFVKDQDRILGGLLASAFMTSTLIAYSQLKSLIPILHPFSWDQAFMELDRMLFLGVDPYRVFHAVFGSNPSLTFFTGIYNFWLFMMYFVLLGACFMRPDSRLRQQYLIAFVLCWSIGGNLVATLLSSAGPVYYAKLGLGDAYAGLMGVLEAHADTGAITVINSQNILWTMHSYAEPLHAISAFPSMHVTSSVLMAIFLSRLFKVLGIASWIFALGIMIGSVLLAWHYAVDGLAGGLIAWAGWLVAGWLIRAFHGAEGVHPEAG